MNCESCGKIIGIRKTGNQNKKFCSSECANNANLPIGSYRTSKKHSQYVDIKTEKGWKLEHRLVMSLHLGRDLKKHEEVHHINGDKHDNRIENLWLLDKKEHTREHFKLFCEVQKLRWENKWLKDRLEKYEQSGKEG